MASRMLDTVHRICRIPHKLAGWQKHLGKLDVGLLGECLDLQNAVGGLLVHLYIAVTGLGPRRLDTESEQGVMVFDKLESAQNAFLEVSLACYQMIARSHYHRCLRISRGNVVRRPGYTWCRVAPCRFKQNLTVVKFGKLLAHN